jgi:hypothetical protein
MEEYRAYVIGPGGNIINRVDIRCSDRFIERFEPEH